MAFQNLRRVERGRGQWQDEQQDRTPDQGANFSGQGSQPLDEEFGRRGWRPGSDYYGNTPERYGKRGYEAGEYEEPRHGGRSYGDSGRPSFNDRWQNAYGGGDFGGEQSAYGESDRYGGTERDPFQDVYSPHYTGSHRPGYGGKRFGSESGPFRGRGPKGYRRSDERIHEEACECLMDDDRIDASSIEVAVKDCEVTLSGSVDSREQKRRAEDLIARLSGVKDVHNGLRVKTIGDS
jgi:hypothetical protein